MFFLVNMYNHSEIGQRSLEDVVGIMGKQLRQLGHQCIWDPRNTQFIAGDIGINIIVEGFTPPTIAVIADAHRQGCRFVILATEEPSDRGFNQGTQKEMVLRQGFFPEAAKYAEGIIHLVPGDHVTRWYGQFAPAAYTELGYAADLVRFKPKQEPSYEFGFYGSLTKRRINVLKKLTKVTLSPKAVRLVGDFKTQEERDTEMRDCKVIIQVRKFEAMGLVSSSRCNTALCIGRPVIAEAHLLSKPWDEIVTFAEDENHFVNLAGLARANWRNLHRDQFERFRTKLPPEACIGKALAELGVLNRPTRFSPRQVAALPA